VAGEGGARELALEEGVSIWGIGSGVAHRGRLTGAKHDGDGEPVMAGRRRGGGCRLRGQRGAWRQREAQGGRNGGSP
jgi:hypothetical protein